MYSATCTDALAMKSKDSTGNTYVPQNMCFLSAKKVLSKLKKKLYMYIVIVS